MKAFKLKDDWLVCYTGIDGKDLNYCLTYIIINMKKSYKNKLPKELEVVSAGVRVENGELIVEVEFKEKFEPKDGDFVITPQGNIYIYNSNYSINRRSYSLFGFYAGINGHGNMVINNDNKTGFSGMKRFATKEEKTYLLARLEKECGKRWNAEKKCLEDIYIPMFGDIVRIELKEEDVYAKNGVIISIYPNKRNYKDVNSFFDIANLGHYGEFLDKVGSHIKHIYPASEDEKKKLFDKLAEIGKRWNPETKKLEDVRWIPNNGEKYWYITEDLAVAFTKYSDMNNLHVFRAHANNCFKTPEAASKVFKQIKEIFKNSKAE